MSPDTADDIKHLLDAARARTLDLRIEIAQQRDAMLNEAELIVFLDGLTEQGR